MNKLALGVGLVLGVISRANDWELTLIPRYNKTKMFYCKYACAVAENAKVTIMEPKDFMERDIGAIIHMSLEFMKDMDMKMRDVRRIEQKYISTNDFGAGKIFGAIEHTFKHMCTLYKNTSRISKIMDSKMVISELRSDVAGSLSFMLSDYMQMLSQIDLYRARFDYWQQYSAHWRVKQTVMDYLIPVHKVYPYRYNPDGDYVR